MSASSTGVVVDPQVYDVPAVAVAHLTRRFGDKEALSDFSLTVRAGEIHALLGPNGAGKTTVLRTLIGLVDPTEGTVQLLGRPVAGLRQRNRRGELALIPSGDRTFYLRLSGLENLIFFARLHGLRAGAARRRAWECLEDVDLTDVGRATVSTYSHGMQKRLSVARAMLTRPRVLLVDEATHDLDPQAARRVQELVSSLAATGTAVLWATQRLDEIRSFADHVTVLREGEIRFRGTVPQLQANAMTRRYVVQLRTNDRDLLAATRAALQGDAAAERAPGEDDEHVLLGLPEDAVLGDVISRLTSGGVAVLACREERSELETAFLLLTGDQP